MALLDLVLLCIIAGFGLFGLWFGLIHTLGSLLGTVFGVFLATRWYEGPAEWLMRTTGWNENFSRVLMFVILFLIINRLIGALFYFLDRTLSILTRLPFISGLNKMLGGIFGVFEGVVVLGITIYFINKYPLSPAFMSALSVSKIAPICVHTASVLWPLVPEALRAIKDSLETIF